MRPKGGTLRRGIPAGKTPRKEACPGHLGDSGKRCHKRRRRSSADWRQLGPTLTPNIGDERARNGEAKPIENQQQNRCVCSKRCDNAVEGVLYR
jgi:hypothetical protein